MFRTRTAVAAWVVALNAAGLAGAHAQTPSGQPGQAAPQFSSGAAQEGTGPAPQFAPSQTPPEVGAGSQANATANPIGGAAGWSAEVDVAAPGAGSGPSPRAQEVIAQIDAYFNGIVNMQGRFVQTDPNQKQTRGKLYVQRPGKIRFDYAPPSLMRIVSDGRYLSVEDHDLKTIDKYPLESTPFRMLLRNDVDLMRDARIVEFVEREGSAILTIEDKSGDSAGRVQLRFAAAVGKAGVELKEWVITDPQGLNTRVQLADLEDGASFAKDFFATATVGFPTSN